MSTAMSSVVLKFSGIYMGIYLSKGWINQSDQICIQECGLVLLLTCIQTLSHSRNQNPWKFKMSLLIASLTRWSFNLPSKPNYSRVLWSFSRKQCPFMQAEDLSLQLKYSSKFTLPEPHVALFPFCKVLLTGIQYFSSVPHLSLFFSKSQSGSIIFLSLQVWKSAH